MVSDRKQTVINLATGIFTMLVALITNFFLSAFLVSELGEEANGFMQLANNFVTYASLLTIAFNSMSARFISVSFYNHDEKKVKAYYSSVMVCNLAIVAMLIPGSLFITLKLDTLLAIEKANIIDVKILFGCVFINFFANIFVSLYNIAPFVLNKLYIQNVNNAIRTVLNGVLLLCAFSILEPRIYYVSLCAMILTFIMLPISGIIQRKLMPNLCFSLHDFNISAAGQMLRSGIWNTVNQGGNLLMTGMDLLFANLFVNPALMGVLAVAKTFPIAITSLSSTLNSNFAPEIVMHYSKGKQAELLKTLRSNMKISSVMLSIPLSTFCAFGVQFYSLWVPSLDAKMLTILSILTCMAMIPWTGPQTLYNVFTATNHLKVNSVAFICTGVLNVVIVFILLKTTALGVYAIAGVSSVLTIIRNLVITAPYTAKLLNLPWYEFYKDVGISLFCCTINYAVAFVVIHIISIPNWFMLTVAVILTCILNLLFDFFIVLTRAERQNLISKLKRIFQNG